MDKEIIRKGRLLAEGASNYLLYLACIFGFILLVLNLARWSLGLGVDDSDKSSWKRSNLHVYTDYKTGVQYVGSRNGLSVRVDSDGVPIVDRRSATY